jgi:hypothetical protein
MFLPEYESEVVIDWLRIDLEDRPDAELCSSRRCASSTSHNVGEISAKAQAVAKVLWKGGTKVQRRLAFGRKGQVRLYWRRSGASAEAVALEKLGP